MIGLAVVTRDGIEIGRVRSLARTLIAWGPILVWLVLVPAHINLGPGPGSVLAVGLVFGAMILQKHGQTPNCCEQFSPQLVSVHFCQASSRLVLAKDSSGVGA